MTDAEYIAILEKAITTDGRRPNATVNRFWSRVDKTPGLGPNGDCWEWRGSRHPRGYGQIASVLLSKTTEPMRTHVVMWELHNRQRVPEGKGVLHNCDNEPCCNPSHLYAGTPKQNTQDILDRHSRISKLHAAKVARKHPAQIDRRIALTQSQGKMIIDRRKQCGLSIYDVADWLGIHFTMYFYYEACKRCVPLEHYHFMTRLVGLDEGTLNVTEGQWVERRTRKPGRPKRKPERGLK